MSAKYVNTDDINSMMGLFGACTVKAENHVKTKVLQTNLSYNPQSLQG